MPLRYLNTLLLTVLAILTASCQPDDSYTATASVDTAFPIRIGNSTAFLELALTQREQTRGLMFRDQLQPDHGMLFAFRSPAPRSFWMRDTSIPLDLAYLTADGVLREIHRLRPYNLNGVPSRRTDIQWVVEVDRGWFREQGISSNAQLNLDDLRKALRQRGVNPASYGL